VADGSSRIGAVSTGFAIRAKYNVTTLGGDAGTGGEYATQIGFGWTNGVLLALTSLYPNLNAAAKAATPGWQVTPAQ